MVLVGSRPQVGATGARLRCPTATLVGRKSGLGWSPQLDAPAAVGRCIPDSVPLQSVGGMPLASPVNAVRPATDTSPAALSHGGLFMPAGGLFSITLSAISLSSGATQSPTGR